MVTLEGTCPLLVEIQALVDSGGAAAPAPVGGPGQGPPGHAAGRAAPPRRRGLHADQDVFVNAVGGVRISEPAADLAVMLAITSSLRGKALPRGFLAFGEVGLAGEVRPAPRGQERLKEAAKLGFTRGRGAQGQRAQKAHRGPDHSRGGAGGRGHERGARGIG